jgi:putative DNA primase/helicase
MNLVPFTVSIPKDERDPGLPEKLREEWPGILRWAIDGCLEWQVEQLRPPKAVLEATDEYLAAEDAVATWIGERCIVKNTFVTRTAKLFASWKAWADQAGEFPGTMKRFSLNLQGRGFKQKEIGHAKHSGFEGIGIVETHTAGGPE